MSETSAHASLLAPMTRAAEEAGAWVHARPRPEAARTMDELRTAFAAVDDPATALLRGRLSALRPDAVWAEEMDTELPAEGAAWVVDAVDGAVQYLQGLTSWCVSVTLVEDGEPVAAVLHSPVLGETYTAALGHGTRRDGVLVSPSGKRDLEAAVLAHTHPSSASGRPEAAELAGRSLSAVLPAVAAVRNLGPTSWQIADVAAGRLDAFWEYGRDDSNLLPGALLAREAGAEVTDPAGAYWRAGATGFVAAPAALHRQLLALLPRPVRTGS
ncbi:inositol monophosphatase family protein [Streptomyces sp. NPDC059072]|uniref:inositol monophosphatase family protein n=1 Tax=Streptomyces sp. NPDC059072 TaxID=3346715 RepID=UPI003676DC9F